MFDKATHYYSQIHQFEPLLPQNRLDVLQEQSLELIQKSTRLGGGIHASTIASIQGLVRSMNSYYSNRIEGQSTHPVNIERALAKDFSDTPSTAKLQRIAIAYIDAEKELEEVGGVGFEDTLRSSMLIEAHRALYGRLLPDDRTTEEGRVIEPGKERQENVTVGRHDPPLWTSVPDFLKRMDQVYALPARNDQGLIRVACAHHRAMWVHPFLDGNGRAVRLQTHLALLPITKGLWSMNRGLARQRDDYYAYLARADQPRHGDLDGRGNLSEKMLWDWCQWFIRVAHDQVDFMEKMLSLSEMRRHIEALIFFRASQDKGIRKEAIAPLYHLYLAGPTKRGDFLQMTGLGERTARTLLSRLLETGLVISAGHKSPVQFAFPLDSLQFLLPNLYPEAAIINS
jgi:Fic family protein